MRIQRIVGRMGRYMTRIFFPFNYRLHIIYRGDEDRDPHDHPYDFWTFPLTSYVEERWIGHEDGFMGRRIEVVRAFRWHCRPAEYTHRIIRRLEPGRFLGATMLTIVKGTPVRRKWGFWVPNDRYSGARHFVEWRDYLGVPKPPQP